MDRTTFENGLREQGYGEVVDRRMQPREVNPAHAHEFDAIFEMPAGRRHSETAGADGARYLAGRRYRSGS
jgi:hypothetical protein